MSKKFRLAALTNVGLVRESNEDNYSIFELDEGLPLVCVVADGMGGHLNGELASKIAVEYVEDRLKSDLPLDEDPQKIQYLLNDTIQKANIKVYLNSLDTPKSIGMGTTLTIAVFYKSGLYIGHIGDSRCYFMRNRYLESLTKDHTVVSEMVEAGTLSTAESFTHPQRHVLTQALGSVEYLKPDILHCDIKKHDRYLLCSDGLHGYVEDNKIEKIMAQLNDPEQMCQKLIDEALAKGGPDNVTVIAVFIE